MSSAHAVVIVSAAHTTAARVMPFIDSSSNLSATGYSQREHFASLNDIPLSPTLTSTAPFTEKQGNCARLDGMTVINPFDKVNP
ncbi:hypothetical protein [Pseudomonas asplenii]|uniref:hypothetical protein n=1 Tax=Pseudomonas asplenii TaxID=53407 RepID=UPI000382064F|nr:hypothetical protein [Pseudomonas fuscovaginae]